MTGSKRITGDNGMASCEDQGGVLVVSTSNLEVIYTATINGAQRTTGTATASLLGVLGGALSEFSEDFAVEGTVQLTSKQQCRDGGWQRFGFKNQGDCVSFLATGGKNPPSES